jgi:hypothetical protein
MSSIFPSYQPLDMIGLPVLVPAADHEGGGASPADETDTFTAPRTLATLALLGNDPTSTTLGAPWPRGLSPPVLTARCSTTWGREGG